MIVFVFPFYLQPLYSLPRPYNVCGADLECTLYDSITVITAPRSEGVIKDLPRFMRLYHYQ